jgi:hypothetical protein
LIGTILGRISRRTSPLQNRQRLPALLESNGDCRKILPGFTLLGGRLEQRLQSTDTAIVNQHERIDMPAKIRLQDLSAKEIAALLARNDKDVTPQQAIALQDFIEDIGGMDNANAAVEMLSQLRRVA